MSQTEPQPSELKACPFCGSDPVHIGMDEWTCLTRGCPSNSPYGHSRDFWNTRATDRELSDLREKLGVAERALEKAIPILETMHSLMTAKDTRQTAYGRLQEARIALATIRAKSEREGE